MQLSEPIRVIASAGTGKTTFYAYRLLESMKTNKPVSVLVIMFNRNAKEDFQERLAQMSGGKMNALNARVMTIHKLAYYICKSLLNRGTQKEDTIYVQLLIKSALELLRSQGPEVVKLNKIAKVKAILVDEAQDLNELEYTFVNDLGQRLGAGISYVGDPKQTIYQFKRASSSFFLQSSVNHQLVLDTNYRSTPAIVNLSHQIAAICDYYYYPVHVGKKPNDYVSDAKPVLFIGEQEYVLDRVMYVVREALERGQTVGVIGFTKNGGHTNVGMQAVRNFLFKEKVPIYVHYNINNEDYAMTNKQIHDKAAHLLTVHYSKGLQFDVACVLDVNHELMRRAPSLADAAEHANLMYVATTRARYYLYMFSTHFKIHSSLFRALDFVDVQSQHDPVSTYQKLKDAHSRLKYKEITTSLWVCSKPEEWCSVEEVGYVVQEALAGRYPGLVTQELYLFPDPSLDMFFDQTAYSRLPLMQNFHDLHKQEMILISGKTLEQLFVFCLTNPLATKEEATAFVSETFSRFLAEFVQDKQASYLFVTYNLYKHEIVAQFMQYFDIYSQMDSQVRSSIYNPQLSYFGVTVSQKCFPLGGQVDLMDDCSVYEFKFSRHFHINNYIQLLMYCGMTGPLPNRYYYYSASNPSNCSNGAEWSNQVLYDSRTPVLVNIRTGLVYRLFVSSDFMAYFFAKASSRLRLNQHVITYDFETTGLCPYSNAVIEYAFYNATLRVPIASSLLHPGSVFVSDDIYALTGINKRYLLSAPNENKFKEDLALITKQHENPSFIAHNGNSFDHVILKRYSDKFGLRVTDRLYDSKIIFRLFSQSDKFSLFDIAVHALPPALVAQWRNQTHRALFDAFLIYVLLVHYSLINDVSI